MKVGFAFRILFLFLITACGCASQNWVRIDHEILNEGFLESYKGPSTVIRDDLEWKSFWSQITNRHNSFRLSTVVDFSQYIIIVAAEQLPSADCPDIVVYEFPDELFVQSFRKQDCIRIPEPTRKIFLVKVHRTSVLSHN